MKVTAPLVIAKREDGSDVYLYQGAPVPEGLRDGEVKRLKELELIGDDSEGDEKPARKSAASK